MPATRPTSSIVLHLLETFFRRPLLHLLPLVLAASAGVLYLAQQPPEYRATGVLLVEDETLLSELTEVRGADRDFRSPADRAGQQVNALTSTSSFLQDVAVGAGLVPEGRVLAPSAERTIQAATGTYTSGGTLLHVWAEDTDPIVAQSLADAVIDSFLAFQIDQETDESTTAEQFLTPITEQYATEVDAAQGALNSLASRFPVDATGARPGNAQVRIEAAQADLAEATTRYRDAVERQESARLATAQTEADVRNRLRLVDEPAVPVEPAGALRDTALLLVGFLVIGAVASAASLALAMALDRTVRFGTDLERRVGLPVLAVVPDVPTGSRSLLGGRG